MGALHEPLLMTVAQFDALPERRDALEELHWGDLVTLSRPKVWHGKLQMKLAQLLQPLAAGAGYVVIDLPFRAVSEYDLRAADLAFLTKSRWDAANDGYLAGAPELVIEIISPSNTKTQLREYAALCLANGCQEFWLIDHITKTVTVTSKNGLSIQYSTGTEIPLTLLGSANLAVDRIFASPSPSS